MKLTHSKLHHHVMTHFIEKGRAPTVNALVSVFQVEKIEMENALKSLQEYHGVVLHPASCEIWAMHPFSNAPTQFWIESVGQGWWGNCAWCALGAAALLERDVTVTTTLGGEAKQIVIKINLFLRRIKTTYRFYRTKTRDRAFRHGTRE